MNNAIEKSDLASVTARRNANDRFRQSLSDGNLILSAGILDLGSKAQFRIYEAVRSFDDFDSSDPWDDHSIGDFEVTVDRPDSDANTILVFFKVIECQVDGKIALTLSLADEWWDCPGAISPPVEEVRR